MSGGDDSSQERYIGGRRGSRGRASGSGSRGRSTGGRSSSTDSVNRSGVRGGGVHKERRNRRISSGGMRGNSVDTGESSLHQNYSAAQTTVLEATLAEVHKPGVDVTVNSVSELKSTGSDDGRIVTKKDLASWYNNRKKNKKELPEGWSREEWTHHRA